MTLPLGPLDPLCARFETAVIWKFPFSVTDTFEVEMPVGAEILAVQTQLGQPVMWAVVDPDAAKETRRFAVRGTGHLVGAVGAYVGTFQLGGGSFVGHLFEAVGDDG